MGKLIKPKHIDDILSKGIVFHSRKQYDSLFKKGYYIGSVRYIPSNYLCAVRSRLNPCYTASIRIHPKYKCAYTPFNYDPNEDNERKIMFIAITIGIIAYLIYYFIKL